MVYPSFLAKTSSLACNFYYHSFNSQTKTYSTPISAMEPSSSSASPMKIPRRSTTTTQPSTMLAPPEATSTLRPQRSFCTIRSAAASNFLTPEPSYRASSVHSAAVSPATTPTDKASSLKALAKDSPVAKAKAMLLAKLELENYQGGGIASTSSAAAADLVGQLEGKGKGYPKPTILVTEMVESEEELKKDEIIASTKASEASPETTASVEVEVNSHSQPTASPGKSHEEQEGTDNDSPATLPEAVTEPSRLSDNTQDTIASEEGPTSCTSPNRPTANQSPHQRKADRDTRQTRSLTRTAQRHRKPIDPKSELQARALLLDGITYSGSAPITSSYKAPAWVQSLFGTTPKEVSEIPVNNTNKVKKCRVAGVDRYFRFPEFEYNSERRESVGKPLKQVGRPFRLEPVVGSGGVGAMWQDENEGDWEELEDTEDDEGWIEAEAHEGSNSYSGVTTLIGSNSDIAEPRPRKPVYGSISNIKSTGITLKSTAPDFSLNPLIIKASIDSPNSEDLSRRSNTNQHNLPQHMPSFPSRIELPHPAYQSAHPYELTNIQSPITPSSSTFSFFLTASEENLQQPRRGKYYELDVGDRYEMEAKLKKEGEVGPPDYFFFPDFKSQRTYKMKKPGKRGGNI